MGFVWFPMSANKLPKTLITLLHLVEIVLYGFSAVLYRLGLNPSFETELSPWENSEELLSSAEPSQPALAEAATVKSRLPAVEYASFAGRRKEEHCGGGGGEAAPPPECRVCLQVLEARERVRELGNCRHAFHVDCIDRWIDLGRFSCPLCRAALSPPGGRKKAAGGEVAAFVKVVVFGIFRCERN